MRSSRGGWVSARARGAVCARAWRVRARAVVFFFARRGCVGASVHALCAGCARCVCARCACVMRSPRVRERCARVGDARIACARVSRCVRACGLCKRCVCAVLLARCLWSLRAACRLCVHGCSECAPHSLRVCVCVCDGALRAARPRLSRRALAGGAGGCRGGWQCNGGPGSAPAAQHCCWLLS